MGFFSKLFSRGNNESNFVPSAELMSEDKFWGLIHTARDKAEGELDQQEEELAKLLNKIPLQDLIAFENRYGELQGRAYTWELWGAAYIINGGCSDDGFCYFRDWLISQGRSTYENALANPESLADLDVEGDEAEAENMAYIAGTVFEDRTGQDIPAEFGENHNIKGTEWKEEGGDLKRMFPRLWEKYDNYDEE